MRKTYDFETPVDRFSTGSLKWEKYADRDILPFWVAVMDFRSAPEIEEALIERARHGVYGYTVPHASVENAALSYLKNQHGIAAEKEWFVWMPGLVPALNVCARAYCSVGESVITNTPVYPPFLLAPEWQGKGLLTTSLVEKDGRYTFDFDAMEKAVNDSTKVFILCNPHNPVGRVFNEEELNGVVDFCRRHGLILVSDEIHCDLILDAGCRHRTVLSLDPWCEENSLTLMAPSKTFNVPGLACSFILIPNPRLRHRFQRAARGLITEVNCFGYAGCEASYNLGMPWLEELLQTLRQNYEAVFQTVSQKMPKVRMVPMEATYLAWMDVRELKLEDPVGWFEDHGIGLSDGTLFGSPGFLRLNFGCPASVLEEGLARLVRGYEAAVSSS